MDDSKRIPIPAGSPAPTIPAYFQIARQIQSRVFYGFYRPGALIPSAKELGRLLGVSPLTARQAIRQLVDQGTLTARQGTGTFVAPDPPTVRPASFLGYLDDLILETRAVKTTVIDWREIPAPPDARDNLDLDAQAQVVQVTRVAARDEQPLRLTTIFLPASIGAALSPADLTGKSTVEALHSLGHSVQLAHQTFGVDKALGEVASRLGVPDGDAVMKGTLVMISRGLRVAYLRTVYRGDTKMYTATLVGPPSVLGTDSEGPNSDAAGFVSVRNGDNSQQTEQVR